MSDHKRNIFGELVEGIEAMKAHREGKITLRSFKVERQQPPAVDAGFIRETRRALRVSAPVLARSLCLSPRTLERWEQGQKPSDAAAVLIALARRYPDTLKRIASLEEAGPRVQTRRLRKRAAR